MWPERIFLDGDESSVESRDEVKQRELWDKVGGIVGEGFREPKFL